MLGNSFYPELSTLSRIAKAGSIWEKAFKNALRKICGRQQSLKKFN